MFDMNVERRDYFAANAPTELKELFFVPYTMPIECPPDIIAKRGTDMRFASVKAAYDHGLDEWEIVNHNKSKIDSWKEEKYRVEEILWRYNYADYMIKFSKKDLTTTEEKVLSKG